MDILNNTNYIYFLHKNDNVPFYIGKTNNIFKRKLNHRKNFGFDICLEVIDEIPKDEWKFWEKHYISLFKSWGFNLLNKNKGGNGPEFFPESAKLRLSQLFKGRICPNKGKKFQNVAPKVNTGRKTKYIITQYDLSGNIIREWPRPKDISTTLKFDLSSIRQVCIGKQHTAYGFKWSWKLKN